MELEASSLYTDQYNRKNSFAEISRNLATDLKIVLLDYQDNYV